MPATTRIHPLRLLTLPLALLLAGALPAVAQPADTLLLRGKDMIRTGLARGDLDELRRARATFERAAVDDRRASLAHYYAAFADYQLAAILMRQDADTGTSEHRAEAATHLDRAVDHLRAAIDRDETSAEAHALLASVYGQKIALRPIMGILLGPRSGAALRTAKQLAPDNPRVVLIEAISDFNTPERWGGDKQQAMEGFRRAARLFAQHPPTDPLQPSWGHTEAYTWLGIGYMEQGLHPRARNAFRKALEIDPENGWVKYVLLPGLEE